MRILVVSNGYPPRGRYGTEFYTRELVQGLRGRGHEVTVLHPVRTGDAPRYTLEEVSEEGVRIVLLHNPGDPRKRRFQASYHDERVESSFDALLERLAPDVVHFTYLLWGLSVGLPRVARARGIPSVVTLTDYGLACHRGQMFDWRMRRCFGPHPPEVCARCIREPGPHDAPPLELLLRRAVVRTLAGLGGMGRVVTRGDLVQREQAVGEAFAAVSRVIAPTRVLAEVFLRAGVPAEKLVELVYSFDEAPYRRVADSPPPDPPRFGFLGQFAPHKGIATLLAAAKLLRDRDPGRAWELVFFGGAPGGRHRLYAPRVFAGNGGGARVAPPFASAEAPEVLAQLSAVVLPSEWDENAPLSILQARAAGVPVIASDVPGIAEVVDREAIGRLHPVGDAPALADRMEEVLSHRIGRNPSPGLPLSLADHLDKIEGLYDLIRDEAR